MIDTNQIEYKNKQLFNELIFKEVFFRELAPFVSEELKSNTIVDDSKQIFLCMSYDHFGFSLIDNQFTLAACIMINEYSIKSIICGEVILNTNGDYIPKSAYFDKINYELINNAWNVR